MSEKPILFSREMMRDILAGRKTQTRRIMKPQPESFSGFIPGTMPNICKVMKHFDHGRGLIDAKNQIMIPHYPCAVGDLLYVRETHRPVEMTDIGFVIEYQADGAKVEREVGYDMKSVDDPYRWDSICECQWSSYKRRLNPEFVEDQKRAGKWIPSIHMPRWTARIWLEVTVVRAERLFDISSEDAEKEGFPEPCVLESGTLCTPRFAFMQTWQRCYPNDDGNPWVFVIEFKVINK